MKVICPNNENHKRFLTTAHEVHDWVVDEEGDFVEDLGCTEVAHKPDVGNVWICKDCSAEAKIIED